MKELDQLLTSIKHELKINGITYAMLAKKLALSEASVKRMFSQKNFSLKRLETICDCVNLDLSDVFELLQKQKKEIRQLTIEQEQELVKDKKLLLVAICILNHWQAHEISQYYNFSGRELIHKLALLDRIKIIELRSGNRFKRLIHADFKWITDGPIQKFFQNNVQADFLQSAYKSKQEILIVRSGMLSKQDNFYLSELLLNTADKFTQTCHERRDLPLDDRQGTALIIAMRPWAPKIFDQYIRQKQIKSKVKKTINVLLQDTSN